MPDRKIRIEKIRKRDGREVAFDEARIADAIYKAAATVGIDDRFLAADLASVVTLYLERYHGRTVPATRDVQEIVEKVLLETGHPTIARAYIHFREEAALPARPPADDLFPAGQLFVEASTRDEATAWGRCRIADALMKEAGLDRATADGVAAEVEKKVFRSGVRRVTTAVIRQLVDHELFTRGLSGKLRRQSVLGVPKFDLDRLVQTGARDGAPDPARVCEVVGEMTLRQYALQDLFEADVAAAHVDGTIHLGNLEQPLKMAWLTPSVEYLKRHGLRLPAPGLLEIADGARSLTAQLRAVAAAAPRYAADAVELVHAETFYAPLVAALGPKELEAEAADLAALLAGPTGAGAAVQPTLHLHVPRALRRLRATGPNATSLDVVYGDLAEPALRLARAVLAILRAAPPSPRRTLAVGLDAQAFKDPARAAVLREACALAAAGGDVLFLVDRGEDLLWPASRLGRFEPYGDGASVPEETWFAAAQAVFVNLPQVAYRGAPGDLEGFYDRMDEAVDLAVKAHQQKHAALRRYYGEAGTFGEHAGWARDGRGVLRLGEAVHLVVPVGLNEAVRHLAGRELGESEDAAKTGLRVLSCLAFRVREASRRCGLRLVLGEYPAGEACARLARLDARRFAPARDRGPMDALPPYTPAYHCRAGSPLALSDRLVLESRFHTLFESGHVDLSFPPGVARGAHDIFTLLQRACLETKAAQVYVR